MFISSRSKVGRGIRVRENQLKPTKNIDVEPAIIDIHDGFSKMSRRINIDRWLLCRGQEGVERLVLKKRLDLVPVVPHDNDAEIRTPQTNVVYVTNNPKPSIAMMTGKFDNGSGNRRQVLAS
jgi:hypothetical protein